VKKLLMVAACVFFAPGYCAAAPVNVIGFQDMSCGAWAASKSIPSNRTVFVYWIRGFLSGHNYANQEHQVPTVSDDTIELYVDKYCRENPLLNFPGAAFRLTDELTGRNKPLDR
jgi:hypothetical protein